MKIVTDNKVYIQKKDIVILKRMAIPRSIFRKILGDGIILVDDSNKYEFIEFDEPGEIIFLKNLDCIIDYYDFKDLSSEEINSIRNSVIEEKSRLVECYNSLPVEVKQENIRLVEKWESLDYKIRDIKDMILFKKGKLDFVLPEGVEYPGMDFGEKGIKRLVKVIFDKLNNKNTSN